VQKLEAMDDSNLQFYHHYMKPGKVYYKPEGARLHVASVNIDPADPNAKWNQDFVRFRVHRLVPSEKSAFTAANLSIKRNIYEVPVDMFFAPWEKVKFSVAGAKVPVNLLGNVKHLRNGNEGKEPAIKSKDTNWFHVEDGENDSMGINKEVNVKTKDSATECSQQSDKRSKDCAAQQVAQRKNRQLQPRAQGMRLGWVTAVGRWRRGMARAQRILSSRRRCTSGRRRGGLRVTPTTMKV